MLAKLTLVSASKNFSFKNPFDKKTARGLFSKGYANTVVKLIALWRKKMLNTREKSITT